MAEPVGPVAEALAKVRAIALALPETAERLSHGAPGFHIAKGKFFAYFSHDLHGSGETAVVLKTSGAEEQAMLIEADPDLYYKPPYLGSSGWIAIRVTAPETDWDHVADRIAASWEMVARRRLLEMGGR
ncbi:MmcQ/YjbR family DNA-binding protein [Sphingomonas mucosissima]|uniref:MmcQ/YjbR family DNA-binding protein n=1 Tax=Sphingomonas mucosissima TaxID=370959 RepID=A0A245ZSP9_9SPHN|nr:MmcQ/YjbR family DNA-binding protein [Sphingomonas mucosissima]OWK32740.1 hypothetical protein SPMU_10820 [Sphingomonas mucosissima]